jgi:hypothetical protein
MTTPVGAIREGVTHKWPSIAHNGAIGESSLCLAVPMLASAARGITVSLRACGSGHDAKEGVSNWSHLAYTILTDIYWSSLEIHQSVLSGNFNRHLLVIIRMMGNSSMSYFNAIGIKCQFILIFRSAQLHFH